MSSNLTAIPHRGPGRPRLKTRPERIDIGGGGVLVRDDIFAREFGISQRTLARSDARGAPFILIGGCKYRPLAKINEFIAAQIITRGQPVPKRRKQKRR